VAGEHTLALTKRNNKTRKRQQAKHQGKPVIAMQRMLNSLRFFLKVILAIHYHQRGHRC
jgi:hypothetical protein